MIADCGRLVNFCWLLIVDGWRGSLGGYYPFYLILFFVPPLVVGEKPLRSGIVRMRGYGHTTTAMPEMSTPPPPSPPAPRPAPSVLSFHPPPPPQRRIYDITNVLEGIGLIHKTSKNNIQWKGAGGVEGAGENDEEDEMQVWMTGWEAVPRGGGGSCHAWPQILGPQTGVGRWGV